MTPAADRLARELCDAILSDEGTDVVDLSAVRAKRKINVLAADLKAALSAPLVVAPWSPWNRKGANR